MTQELSAFFYEQYFDEEDFELKDIDSMSLKQLVIYKKQLLNLKEAIVLTLYFSCKKWEYFYKF